MPVENLCVDVVQEDKLLMPKTPHVGTDDGIVSAANSAVPFFDVAWLHRQPRLGAIESLNLALLVDRKDDCMKRVDIGRSHP